LIKSDSKTIYNVQKIVHKITVASESNAGSGYFFSNDHASSIKPSK